MLRHLRAAESTCQCWIRPYAGLLWLPWIGCSVPYGAYGMAQRIPRSLLDKRAPLTSPSLQDIHGWTLVATGPVRGSIRGPSVGSIASPARNVEVIMHPEPRLDATLTCGRWTQIEMASCGDPRACRHILTRPTSTRSEHHQETVGTILVRGVGAPREQSDNTEGWTKLPHDSPGSLPLAYTVRRRH